MSDLQANLLFAAFCVGFIAGIATAVFLESVLEKRYPGDHHGPPLAPVDRGHQPRDTGKPPGPPPKGGSSFMQEEGK